LVSDTAEVLSLRLRKEDEDEVRAASGLEPGEALAFIINYEVEASVILMGGKIVGLFGLSELPSDLTEARPWMLATDALFSGKDSLWVFTKRSKEIVKEMNKKYHWLSNYVAVSNTQAIRWLTWLGFSFDPEPVTLVDPAVQFVRFWKEAV
jgi:hypothetical protein